jgi:hypothetical protein
VTLRQDEVVEGCLLVAELGEEAGLAVWHALRDARRLGTERSPPPPPGRMGTLRGLSLPQELWAPLAVLACLADGAAPADELRLRHACRRIVRWAEANRAWRTALAWEALLASHRDTEAQR